jgi:uncharacterized protein (TIGR02284 family)
MEQSEVIAILNDLIRINHDGQKGYRAAADAIENSDYQTLLFEYAEQRELFTAQLIALVHHYGGAPEDSGDLAAAFHRAWLGIKAAVTSGDAATILAECERGDEIAIEAYQDAMAKDLPEEVRSLIRHQFTDIKLAYERVSALNTALSQKS